MISEFNYQEINRAKIDFDSILEKDKNIEAIINNECYSFKEKVRSIGKLMEIIANDEINENFHVEIITPSDYAVLSFGLQKIPYLILANDTINWSYFISAIYTILYNYVSLQILLIEDLDDSVGEEKNIRRQLAQSLVKDVEVIEKFAKLNVGYKDLLLMTEKLVMKQIELNQIPAYRSVQLSNAFLSSLGYDPEG